MNNIFNKIVSFTQMKYMRVITNGFMSVAAVSIAGSIFTLIKSLPIIAWQTFLTNSGLGSILSIPVSITSDLMALYIVIAMAVQVSKEFKKDGLSCAVIALGAFMILTPFTATVYNADYTEATQVSNVISVSALGAQGIFLAIIVGITASRLYIFFDEKGWKIKMPDSVPPNVTKMFEMMIPGGLVFLVYLVIRWGFSLTSFATAQSFIYTILQAPLVNIGGGYAGVFVYCVLSKILWLFGIHGGMVCYSAMASIMGTVGAANAAAFAAGTAAPYPEWGWALVLMDAHVLPLTIAMMMVCKSQQFKTLSKLSLPTSIFNISEPLVFGVPVVMNPIIAIPFIITEIFNVVATLGLSSLGILAAPTGASINNMIPTPIQAMLINSSWTGLVWGILIIVINVVIYLPFVKMLDKKALEDEAAQAAEA